MPRRAARQYKGRGPLRSLPDCRSAPQVHTGLIPWSRPRRQPAPSNNSYTVHSAATDSPSMSCSPDISRASAGSRSADWALRCVATSRPPTSCRTAWPLRCASSPSSACVARAASCAGWAPSSNTRSPTVPRGSTPSCATVPARSPSTRVRPGTSRSARCGRSRTRVPHRSRLPPSARQGTSSWSRWQHSTNPTARCCSFATTRAVRGMRSPGARDTPQPTPRACSTRVHSSCSAPA